MNAYKEHDDGQKKMFEKLPAEQSFHTTIFLYREEIVTKKLYTAYNNYTE